MNGTGKICPGKFRRRGKRCGKKPFHVGRTTPVEPIGLLSERERFRRPAGLSSGNDIHMARQNITRDIPGADRGKDVGPVTFRPWKHGDVDSEALQIRLDPADDPVIRRADDARKGDKTGEDFNRVHMLLGAAAFADISQ
ncbi:hypothetical protein RsS62_04810 [Rhizobium dioscoreae]|nr:hypothetical protein RsS62_04810 [Rhizobium dioscoreae]